MNRSFLRRVGAQPTAGTGAIEIESLNAYSSVAVFGLGIVSGAAGAYFFNVKGRLAHLGGTLEGMKTKFGVTS